MVPWDPGANSYLAEPLVLKVLAVLLARELSRNPTDEGWSLYGQLQAAIARRE